MFFCFASLGTAPQTSSFHQLPFPLCPPTHLMPHMYIIGTFHCHICELFPLLLHSQLSHTSYCSHKISWYAISFTLLFSSLTINTFFTPYMISAILQPPTNFSRASTKKVSDLPPPSPLHTFTSNSLQNICFGNNT